MKLTNKKNIKQEYIYKCKVTRVVDGDTIDVDIPVGFGIIKAKQRCRASGIDTPESRTRNKAEKKLGLAAKVRMKELCAKECYIESLDGGKLDKYGRLLTNLYTLDGTNICATLINEGHAVKYKGGKKKHVWA